MHKKIVVRWCVAALFLAIALMVVFLNFKIDPLLEELAGTNISNEASDVINDAIEELLEEGEIDYNKIVCLEKNVDGDITAIKTNIAEVNRIKTKILRALDERLLMINVSEIGIPLGNLLLPRVLSGIGPKLPLRIVSVSTTDADFRNVFTQAGINQTLHQIMLDVTVVMSIMTPAGSQNVSVTSSVIVAETVIVGAVPNSYVDLNR